MQELQPRATISTGGGGGSQWDPQGGAPNCHEALSDKSDVTWLRGVDGGQILKMWLSAGLVPGAGPRAIKFRAAADMLSLGFTDPGKVTFEIRDSIGVLIEALESDTIADDQTPLDYEIPVTAPIEDYSDLQLWVGCNGDWTIGLDLGLFEAGFFIPDPAPTTATLITTGWTDLPPLDPLDREVFCDPEGGDDGNDGLSAETPKKFLTEAVNLLREGFGDRLLIKAGTTADQVNQSGYPTAPVPGGNSPTRRTVVSRYGEGARPIIKPINDGFIGSAVFSGGSHIEVRDIVIDGSDQLSISEHPDGITIQGTGCSDIFIENVLVHHCFSGISINTDSGTSATIRRCVVHTNWAEEGEGHAQGIYVAGIDGLNLEDNVLDHNGWKPGHDGFTGVQTTQFRRNLYVQGDESGGTPADTCANVTYRRNISARSSSEAAQLRSGGDATANLHLLNTGFYHGKKEGVAVTHRIAYNCTLDSRNINGDTDRGGGLEIGIGGTDCFKNLFAFRSTASSDMLAVAVKAGGNAEIHHNVIYDWSAAPSAGAPLGVADTEAGVTFDFHHNDVQFPTANAGTAQLCCRIGAPGDITLDNNRYLSPATDKFSDYFNNYPNLAAWQAASSQDAASVYGTVGYKHPDRNISTYMASIGGTPSLSAFMEECRRQERGNWRYEFTAGAVLSYMFDAFSDDAGATTHTAALLTPIVSARPTGLAAEPSETTIALSWDDEPEGLPLFDHYNIYKDGVKVGESVTASYEDTPGDEDEHTYKVSVVDDADWETGYSDEVEAAVAEPEPEEPVEEPTPGVTLPSPRFFPTGIAPKTYAAGTGTLAVLTPLGFNSEDGAWVPWDADGELGEDTIRGFVGPEPVVLDPVNTKLGNVIMAGTLHVDDVVLPSGQTSGNLLKALRACAAFGYKIQGLLTP